MKRLAAVCLLLASVACGGGVDVIADSASPSSSVSSSTHSSSLSSVEIRSYEFSNDVRSFTGTGEEVLLRSNGATDLVGGATSATVSLTNNSPVDVIVVGASWWIREDGLWEPTTSEALSWRLMLLAPLIQDDFEWLTTVGDGFSLLADETSFGVQVRHERLVTDELALGLEPPETPGTARIDRWITGAGVVLRFESHLEDETGQLVSVWEATSINQPVEITAPPG